MNSHSYDFLLINMFLAWLPLIFALFIKQKRGQIVNLFFFCLWLLFFPNAGYGFTDLWHLNDIPSQVLWLDIILLFCYSMNCMFISSLSMDIIHNFLLLKFSVKQSWSIVIFLLSLTSIGIYMGRFLRLNSWDVLLNPLHIFQLTFERYINPGLHPIALPFSFVVTTTLLGSYIFLRFFTSRAGALAKL